ncbi:MAG TPA: flagellar basal body rod protein FlgC [Geobacteraceae bacterium]|jgi:flagellar basal-body rod protein FlgC|nr:flagellar basal body rod protein FlgC [Geobacteraceae bacterium]
MDFFDAMAVSSSAMTAERTRMNLISGNLANAGTTRTQEGGPYKRKDAVFSAVPVERSFSDTMKRLNSTPPGGVEISRVIEDTSPPRLQYDPTHPDADAQGYVAMPNVNFVEEMADMITASRAYEANITAAQASKSMALKTLELGR